MTNGANSQSVGYQENRFNEKDAEVVNRVYIKASDLPLTQVVT
jgi:hypothetical protein